MCHSAAPACSASVMASPVFPPCPDPLQVRYREEGVLEVAVGLKTATRQDHGTRPPAAVGRYQPGRGLPVQDGHPAGGKARQERMPQGLTPPQGWPRQPSTTPSMPGTCGHEGTTAEWPGGGLTGTASSSTSPIDVRRQPRRSAGRPPTTQYSTPSLPGTYGHEGSTAGNEPGGGLTVTASPPSSPIHVRRPLSPRTYASATLRSVLPKNSVSTWRTASAPLTSQRNPPANRALPPPCASFSTTRTRAPSS